MIRPNCTCDVSHYCRPCELIATRVEYVSLWSVSPDEANEVRKRVGAHSKKTSGRHIPAGTCRLRSEEPLLNGTAAKLGLPTGKAWYECGHPAKPNPHTRVGLYVCGCEGCGPSCKGFTATLPANHRRYDLAGVPVGKRHLSYHVYPVKGSPWHDRVKRIVDSIDLFNGSVVVAVAVDETTDSADDVRRILPASCDVLEFANNPELGETLTWAARWEHILGHADAADAVLYGHAKGTSPKRWGVICQEWSSLLHDLSLDHWRETEELLRRYPIVGSLRKHGNGFPPPSGGDWHYSGTFYWLRVGELRSRGFGKIAQHRWGVESWPGETFGIEEAGSLFGEFKNPGGKGDYPEFEAYHSARTWRENVLPAYQRFVSARDPAGTPIDVITPCSRPLLLLRVRASLDLLAGCDHRWHVINSPGGTFGNAERNTALDGITRDSWVYCLDDDNAIHPAFAYELQAAIEAHPDAVGFVFRQLDKSGKTRLPASLPPVLGKIDTAQFVFRRSAIGAIRWPTGRHSADFAFARDVCAANPGRIVAVDRPACWYNYLR